jgi:glucans biosynthesis protein
MTVYALLDSPSVAGAYKLVVKPGEQTTVAVEMRLFLRREVRKLGIAPLTSMFFHGENSIRTVEDFRPESHDSDGLLLHFNTGEWLWRPIDNPRALNVSSFQMQAADGFGLVQRDRDFVNYQDLETRSETRPSMWVAAQGKWGPGRVEVVEIPTKSDTNDNIVAYWVPERELKPEEPIMYAYTISWYGDDPTRPPGGRVVATRRDRGTKEDAYRFVLDFAGKSVEAIPADRVLRGVVTVVGGEAAGEVLDQQVVKNPVTGAWRLSFQVRPAKKEPLELRAFLDEGGVTLTETWSYVVMP